VECVVPKWKELLVGLGKHKAADAIANPKDYANLFPDFDRGLEVSANQASSPASASDYSQHKEDLFRDLLNESSNDPTAANESEELEPSVEDDVDDTANVDDVADNAVEEVADVDVEAEVDDEFHEASPTSE
ncbi:hypothetical protein GGI03_009397, partial [Coemansia sp. RSA 2337]